MNDEGAMVLVGAIIGQACKDYIKALYTLGKSGTSPDKHKAAAATKKECERFFASEWCDFLSPVSGKELLQKSKQKADRKIERFKRKAGAAPLES